MFRPLARYADFRGRSTRSEFWLFYLLLLFTTAVCVVSGAVIENTTDLGGDMIAFNVLNLVYLATVVPWLAAAVRRLHDIDRSGFWIFAALIPGGVIVLLMFWFRDGTLGGNRFGPDPKARASADIVA